MSRMRTLLGAMAAFAVASCWYQPEPTDSFQWILDGTAQEQSDEALASYKIIDFDFREGEDESEPKDSSFNAQAVAARRAKIEHWKSLGHQVVAYIPGGDWENYRRDYQRLAAVPGALGNTIGGWPNERYVNFTGNFQQGALDAVEDRILEAKADGFQGVELDYMEAAEDYHWDTSSTGFPVTHQEQIAWNRALYEFIHAQNMFVVHKGYALMAHEFANDADMALVESCFDDASRYSNCVESLDDFVALNKLVVIVQYDSSGALTADAGQCELGRANGWQVIFKRPTLSAPIATCPGG